ncbi:PLP-dependent aminotransferase family protein [Deltaproteobacteria bacterium Smac51]|nr:PLP-dependent aminotransferase family protein [Deltaproteobacteria bacterium Smac51]
MLGLRLKKNGEIALYRQLYQQLRDQMLSGGLQGGEALPSTRTLAESLSISRNTVVEAYELLQAEGFIESRPGAPTRVVPGLDIGRPLNEEKPEPKEKRTGVSTRVNFKTGQPDLRLFPKYLWNKLTSRVLTDLPPEEFGYRRVEGHPRLRAEIADWLRRSRGLTADAEDIFISSGATQALFILADLLNRPGRAFAIESPSHPGFRSILNFRQYPVKPVPVDENGLRVKSLPNLLSAVYVTPSHQFPLGGIMEAARRTELIRLARANDFFIIEDDYDSEFRYHGPPVSPIHSLDNSRVIYVGTFSKSVFPALRVGFVILPRQFQAGWIERRRYLDVHNPVLEQLTLAEFMRLRKIDRHIRQMRSGYAAKRKILLDEVTGLFRGQARLMGDAAGLHAVMELPDFMFDDTFIQRCRGQGLLVQNLKNYSPDCFDEHRDKLLLGYGHLAADEIRLGLRILAGECGFF